MEAANRESRKQGQWFPPPPSLVITGSGKFGGKREKSIYSGRMNLPPEIRRRTEADEVIWELPARPLGKLRRVGWAMVLLSGIIPVVFVATGLGAGMSGDLPESARLVVFFLMLPLFLLPDALLLGLGCLSSLAASESSGVGTVCGRAKYWAPWAGAGGCLPIHRSASRCAGGGCGSTDAR